MDAKKYIKVLSHPARMTSRIIIRYFSVEKRYQPSLSNGGSLVDAISD